MISILSDLAVNL